MCKTQDRFIALGQNRPFIVDDFLADLLPVGRVAGVHCCTPAPSEPDLRLSPHLGSSIPKAQERTRSCRTQDLHDTDVAPHLLPEQRVRQLPLLLAMNSGQADVHQAVGLSSGIPSPRGLPQVLMMRHQMEVCPLSRGMMLSGNPDAIPIPPITGWHSLAPSSCARSPIGLPCGSLSQREDYGFTTFRMSTDEWVRSRLFAGGASSAVDDFEASIPGHLPFGSSLSAPLACSR